MGSHYVTAYTTILKLTQQFRNLHNNSETYATNIQGEIFSLPFCILLKTFVTFAFAKVVCL